MSLFWSSILHLSLYFLQNQGLSIPWRAPLLSAVPTYFRTKKGTVVDYVWSITLSFKNEPTRYMTAVCWLSKEQQSYYMSVVEVII
jgi:hypothetical protein